MAVVSLRELVSPRSRRRRIEEVDDVGLDRGHDRRRVRRGPRDRDRRRTARSLRRQRLTTRRPEIPGSTCDGDDASFETSRHARHASEGTIGAVAVAALRPARARVPCGSRPSAASAPTARPCAGGRSAGVTSTHSSSRMNSSACSSESGRGGISRTSSSAGRRAHVRELLLLGRVHVDVLGARVLADDHALVDVVARARRTARRAPAGSGARTRSSRPRRSATSEPVGRVRSSPCHGS